MLWQCTLAFNDIDGNTGRCALHTNAATDVAALVAFANGFAGAAQSISNASLTGAKLTHSWRKPPAQAPATSDVRRKILLLSRQDERYGSIVVPSGNYSRLQPLRCGLRYTERSEADSTLRATIDSLLSLGLVNSYGEPIPGQDWVLAGMSDA